MEPHFLQFGMSLLLGLLAGLQREYDASHMAGMRTFPLIAALGHWGKIRGPEQDLGTTTEVAMILMFALGVLLTVEGMLAVAAAAGLRGVSQPVF